MEPLVVARIEALSQLEADPSLADALETARPGAVAGLLAERDTYRGQLGVLRSKQYTALAAAIASLLAEQRLRRKLLTTLANGLYAVLLGRRQHFNSQQRALVTDRGQPGTPRHHLLHRVLQHLLRSGPRPAGTVRAARLR
jgi:hypothetical protein